MAFWNRKDKDQDLSPEPVETEEDMPAAPVYKAPLKMPDVSKKREFIVGHNFDRKTGVINGFFVTDCFDDAELQEGLRPEIARFPVTQLYDAHEQKQRADKYAEYMNRINEAKQKAYEQTLLIDVLKDNV